MASVTPTAPMALAADKLRTMVALSPTFQRFTGATSAAQAAQRVHLKNVLGERTRPHAIISGGDTLRWGLAGGGGFNHLRPAGSLALYLARDTPAKFYEDLVQAEFDALNFFGKVLQDVADLAAKDDHLSITGIDVLFWGENEEARWDDLGRFYFLAASVAWGDGSF